MIETHKLNIQPALDCPDDFYNALVDMHRELTEEQSRMANAKLILLLANHIGDQETLEEALKITDDPSSLKNMCADLEEEGDG